MRFAQYLPYASQYFLYKKTFINLNNFGGFVFFYEYLTS